MKKPLSLIGFLVVLSLSATQTHARQPCTDPIPEIFPRVSTSVVLITAVSIDPFKVSNRFTPSMGSGFIISPEGLILTNSHVVFGRRAIAVTLDDQTTLPAMPVGADPILDMALIRLVNPPKGLPAATLGDSDLIRVGEPSGIPSAWNKPSHGG